MFAPSSLHRSSYSCVVELINIVCRLQTDDSWVVRVSSSAQLGNNLSKAPEVLDALYEFTLRPRTTEFVPVNYSCQVSSTGVCRPCLVCVLTSTGSAYCFTYTGYSMFCIASDSRTCPVPVLCVICAHGIGNDTVISPRMCRPLLRRVCSCSLW